ncbi:MAG TPA: helix-turn-helix domain-containing protein [Pseudoxanthomonas sp.]
MTDADIAALPLTKKERMVLDQLLAANGETVTRTTIAATTNIRERDPASFSNPQDVLISRLRKKLREAGTALIIKTVRSQGYRLQAKAGAA